MLKKEEYNIVTAVNRFHTALEDALDEDDEDAEPARRFLSADLLFCGEIRRARRQRQVVVAAEHRVRCRGHEEILVRQNALALSSESEKREDRLGQDGKAQDVLRPDDVRRMSCGADVERSRWEMCEVVRER
ncbi:hypothetical protein CISG_04266 [Coccidioides immitis RMSCC 3703]|uniref:Uncharacterized protein n=1 Tax=Coccidioides immitis RMSCC 3703 TaxID=454286 RepID=A0A0J8QPV7_COCIT|nr:hypothetical protein CISG_04266 [Coccidioides immitis RMSCC 3703]